MKSRRILFGVVAGLVSASAQGASVDLTSAGSSGMINGAWYVQTDPQPTGTGVIRPFVRIDNKVTESGYNTDYRPVEFDTKDENQWTHAIQVTDIPLVSYQGGDYRQFLLDINEEGNDPGKLLTLDKVEIYLGPTNLEHAYPSLGLLIYDMDAGGDNKVELDYKLNHGSGSGDMFLLVPNDLFGLSANEWVYLYSHFGIPEESDAGFEEWAVLEGGGPPPPPPPPPGDLPPGAPLPAAAWAGMALFGGLGLKRRRRD